MAWVLEGSPGPVADTVAPRLCLLDEPGEALRCLCRGCGGVPRRGRASRFHLRAIRPRSIQRLCHLPTPQGLGAAPAPLACLPLLATLAPCPQLRRPLHLHHGRDGRSWWSPKTAEGWCTRK